eukprot:SAG22_NODE_1684_length_3811_cov_1.797414_6_plen_57_part_00
MPSTVRSICKLGAFHEIEVEDDVTAVLEYANGATGAVQDFIFGHSDRSIPFQNDPK